MSLVKYMSEMKPLPFETTQFYLEGKDINIRSDEYPGNINEIGNLSGFGMVINCIIGTGFFAIPSCYFKAGLPLSILMTLLCGLMAGIGAVWSLEVQARARNYDLCNKNKDLLNSSNNKITFKKIEFSTFAYIFSGAKGRIFVSLVLLLYTQGSLWAYVSVFSSTTANLFTKYILNVRKDCIIETVSTSQCQLVFSLSACFFAAFVFLVLLFEVDKLRFLQNFFTLYRFVSFTLIVVSCIISLAYNGSQWPKDRKKGWYAFQLSGFPSLFASVSVGLNSGFNLPNALSTPLKRPKNHAHHLAFYATIVVGVLYVGVATIIAFAVGPDVLEFVVLNWSKFGKRGFEHTEGEVVSSWWSVLLKLVIMLFPMMNMLSIYPLVVGTVGGSLYAAFTEQQKERLGKIGPILCRFVAAAPPFVLALVLPNLQSIMNFAGLWAIFLEVFIPAYYLQFSKKLFGPAAQATPYTGWWSHTLVVSVVFVVAVCFFVYSVVQFFVDLLK